MVTTQRFGKAVCGVSIAGIATLWLIGAAAPLHAQALETIRNDVREAPPPAPPAASTPPQSETPQTYSGGSDYSLLDEETKSNLFLGGVIVAGATVSAPIWLPHYLMGDDYSRPAYLHQFPYDDTTTPPESFSVAARFDADYVAAFDNLDRINGHLLLSTASRFEIDTRFQHLAERLPNGGQDQLWTGDCNVTFRIAQGEAAQFRAGLGINWLNDPSQTDLGFNFTYGADLFPARPWVLSTVIDAGTLGHAGLFRFRTTAGVVYRSVELYSGYEYTDIGRVHWNGLIGGVRLWF
jgi:hypothetical protein